MDRTIFCLFLLPIIFGVEAQCPADRSPLPYNKSCGSFYNCSTGAKILENCPTGTFYNCMTQTCGAKTFNFCCESADSAIYFQENEVNMACLNGTVSQDFRSGNKFFVCVNGTRILTGECDTGYLYCEASKTCYKNDSEACTPGINHINGLGPYSVTNGTWVSEALWAICPKDNSNFNDQTNCSIFYNCSSGVPKVYMCPKGYYYDCFNDVCRNVTSSFCCFQDPNIQPSSQLRTTMYECKNGKNTILDDAHMFYECMNNQILKGSCGSLSVCRFSKSCYAPILMSCTRNTTSTLTSSAPTGSTGTTLMPNTSESTTKINLNFSTTLDTSGGSWFECLRGSNTSVIGDYTDCTKYIYFNSSGSFTFQCADKKFFNSFRKNCSYSTYTPACAGASNQPAISDDFCPCPGRSVENLKSCDSFFYCDGRIHARSCPSGQLFDWKLEKCTSAFSATVVPGCTTSKYNQCINKNNFRGQICKYLTWPTSFLFKNVENYCKTFICTVTWFV